MWYWACPARSRPWIGHKLWMLLIWLSFFRHHTANYKFLLHSHVWGNSPPGTKEGYFWLSERNRGVKKRRKGKRRRRNRKEGWRERGSGERGKRKKGKGRKKKENINSWTFCYFMNNHPSNLCKSPWVKEKCFYFHCKDEEKLGIS